MNREQLEHVIRAAAAVTGEDDLVVVGSQSVLGSVPQAPDELLVSVDADIYPRHRPELATGVDGAIGEGSLFFDTFGYHAHGVGPETITAPAGWEDRLVPLRSEGTRGATGWCLEPHDLVLAKCVASRDKDWEFAEAALRHGVVDGAQLLARWPSVPLDDERRAAIEPLLHAVVARSGR
jgi:hypothetical protein